MAQQAHWLPCCLQDMELTLLHPRLQQHLYLAVAGCGRAVHCFLQKLGKPAVQQLHVV